MPVRPDAADAAARLRGEVPPRRAQPPCCQMVIFGANGDLTRRLIVPALYNLTRAGLLPPGFRLVGVDRNANDAAGWCRRLRQTLATFVNNGTSEFDIDRVDDAVWAKLTANARYVHGDFTQDDTYGGLQAALADGCAVGNVLFYLAVPDRLFAPIIAALGRAHLTRERHGADGFWRRVVVEKPFGHSLASAKRLNAQILQTLAEPQIYRIDHFLGKDTVQSIMALRFANGLFEPIWNRDRIDHVQITAAETIGVGTRGNFYEATGALRDMVPNHLFTLLSMVAMEPPTGFDADEIRASKYELFRAMPEIAPGDVVRGQYGAGAVLGAAVPGYLGEANVAPDSKTETYVALKVAVNNWRWAGVPFYLRTGKRLSNRLTEIAICFKQAPYALFQRTPVESLHANWLVLKIAPQEGISMQFEVKRPGPVVDLAAVRMEFCYDDWFPKDANVGYEALIHSAMLGDQTLFMRADMVEEAWRVVQPALDSGGAPSLYEAGSAGPARAAMLVGQSGRKWRPLDGLAPHRPR